MIENKTKAKAFGLIEVLIASTIIVMTISSLTFVAQGALTSTDRTQDRTQAANLAAEGIEIVRSIRDTNWIDQNSGTSWKAFYYTPATGVWSDASPATITNGSTIKFDPVKHRFYLIAGAGETISLNGSIFTRVMYIDTVGGLMSDVTTSANDKSDQALKVTAVVTTPSGAEVKTSEVLTNWRPNF